MADEQYAGLTAAQAYYLANTLSSLQLRLACSQLCESACESG